jgi:hypothetical protein
MDHSDRLDGSHGRTVARAIRSRVGVLLALCDMIGGASRTYFSHSGHLEISTVEKLPLLVFKEVS